MEQDRAHCFRSTCAAVWCFSCALGWLCIPPPFLVCMHFKRSPWSTFRGSMKQRLLSSAFLSISLSNQSKETACVLWVLYPDCCVSQFFFYAQTGRLSLTQLAVLYCTNVSTFLSGRVTVPLYHRWKYHGLKMQPGGKQYHWTRHLVAQLSKTKETHEWGKMAIQSSDCLNCFQVAHSRVSTLSAFDECSHLDLDFITPLSITPSNMKWSKTTTGLCLSHASQLRSLKTLGKAHEDTLFNNLFLLHLKQ